jgi:hypothetical protein
LMGGPFKGPGRRPMQPMAFQFINLAGGTASPYTGALYPNLEAVL